MKKLFSISMLLLSSLCVSAQELNIDSIMQVTNQVGGLHRLSPKYLNNYYTTDWKSNWFAGVQMGLSAFTGSPVGCGDLFDRITPSVNLYVGKWHNPFVGTRLVFQTGKFKDMELKKHSFNAYHADFLYNITNHFIADGQVQRRWDVIPYLGIGLANGATLHHQDCPCDACNGSNNSFMVTYGIHGRYRLSNRLHLTGEFGGIRTFNDFDGHGSRHRFCDHLLSASIGLSVNIGKYGFSHPIDAKPYIAQNDYLLNNYEAYRNVNLALHNQHKMDQNTIAQLSAALEAEGLWDKYSYILGDKARTKRNYYNGLLSLRSRMKEARMQEQMQNQSTQKQFLADNSVDSILNNPVFFFFRKGKARLTDRSQLVNLDEIARVTIDNNIILRIDGSADSATGSRKVNDRLSRKRAQYIFLQLQKRGVAKEQMKVFAHGGVNMHDRKEEDRNTKVSVYVED